MTRANIPAELHSSITLLSEASWRARLGEWNLCGIALTQAYRILRDVATVLEMDLEEEARRLEAEHGGRHER